MAPLADALRIGRGRSLQPFAHSTLKTFVTGHASHAAIVGSAPPGDAPGMGEPLALQAMQRTLHWRTEDDTHAFAQRLAQVAPVRDALITLHGDLGAGKTTLVRHLLRALGVGGRIKSPTYAVVEPYDTTVDDTPLSIWHFDCYRFGDPREWEDAGFRDVFASPGLKLVEWPEKAAGVLPVPDLEVWMAVQDDDSRTVTLRAGTPRGQALLDAT